MKISKFKMRQHMQRSHLNRRKIHLFAVWFLCRWKIEFSFYRRETMTNVLSYKNIEPDWICLKENRTILSDQFWCWTNVNRQLTFEESFSFLFLRDFVVNNETWIIVGEIMKCIFIDRGEHKWITWRHFQWIVGETFIKVFC